MHTPSTNAAARRVWRPKGRFTVRLSATASVTALRSARTGPAEKPSAAVTARAHIIGISASSRGAGAPDRPGPDRRRARAARRGRRERAQFGRPRSAPSPPLSSAPAGGAPMQPPDDPDSLDDGDLAIDGAVPKITWTVRQRPTHASASPACAACVQSLRAGTPRALACVHADPRALCIRRRRLLATARRARAQCRAAAPASSSV